MISKADAVSAIEASEISKKRFLSFKLCLLFPSAKFNIAEGNYRYSLKERARFFSIARASAGEVSSILDIAHAYNLINDEDYYTIQNLLLSIVKMLYRLR